VAHYAEVANGIVQRVVVVSNDVTHVDGVENEALGAAFLSDLLPGSGTWVRTSYSGSIRGRYAGIGYRYDADRDEFVPPDWVLIDGVWTAPELPTPPDVPA
jgi:hypothetical protein